MRRTVLLAAALLTLFLGLAPAATAQTVTTLPGVPAGQGGPDNNINVTQQGGDAPGGRDNPAVDAGPAVSERDDASLAPWLIGAGVLALLVAAGAAAAFTRRRPTDRREPSYSA